MLKSQRPILFYGYGIQTLYCRDYLQDIVPLIRAFMPFGGADGKPLANSPFCHYYSLTVSPDKVVFKCFRCQKGGRGIYLCTVDLTKVLCGAPEVPGSELSVLDLFIPFYGNDHIRTNS